MITFTPNDMDSYFHYAEGIVDIYWKFNQDGTPDFENTLFNIVDLVWSSTEDELKKHTSKQKIELMKANHKDIQLTNIPINYANVDFVDQIPQKWYDKDLELFFERIG